MDLFLLFKFELKLDTLLIILKWFSSLNKSSLRKFVSDKSFFEFSLRKSNSDEANIFGIGFLSSLSILLNFLIKFVNFLRVI